MVWRLHGGHQAEVESDAALVAEALCPCVVGLFEACGEVAIFALPKGGEAGVHLRRVTAQGVGNFGGVLANQPTLPICKLASGVEKQKFKCCLL